MTSKDHEHSAGRLLRETMEAIPFARHLGFRIAPAEFAPAVLYVPFREGLVGNMMLPAYHGGVLGTLMQSAAMVKLFGEAGRLPKLVDSNVDYLRSAGPCTLYADCELVRVGRRIAAVTSRCWQRDSAHCVALARMHFLLEEGGIDQRAD